MREEFLNQVRHSEPVIIQKEACEVENQYMMDLSNLPAGIYMIILSSAKEDEMHERLVIRE